MPLQNISVNLVCLKMYQKCNFQFYKKNYKIKLSFLQSQFYVDHMILCHHFVSIIIYIN
jgi:hypothetical protein